MNTWKKIAALFAITAPLGILASACAVDTTGPTETTESASTDDAAANPELSTLDEHGDRDRGDFDRDGHGRFCERYCYREFERCRYSHRPHFVCRRELNRCFDRCRYRHF